jgi:hypothetical protein
LLSVFENRVAATLDDPDDSTIKAATIALMSSTYGFALFLGYYRVMALRCRRVGAVHGIGSGSPIKLYYRGTIHSLVRLEADP